jgi:hypothetical protein
LAVFEDVKTNHPDVALDAAIYGKVFDILAGKWKEEDDYQINDLWMASAISRDEREEEWDKEWVDEWEESGDHDQMMLFEEREAERRRQEMRKKEDEQLQRETEEREREEREEEERKQRERAERAMSEMEKQKLHETNTQYVDKAFVLLDDMRNVRSIDPDYATFFKLMSLCLKRDNAIRGLHVFDLFKQETVLPPLCMRVRVRVLTL